MRILFSVRNPWYVRHYDAVLRRLAERGHTIDLVADGLRRNRAWPESVEALAREHPSITLRWLPPVAGQTWLEFGTRVRQALYFTRFLRPDYRGMPSLLARAEQKAPAWVVRAARWPIARTPKGLAMLERLLRAVERVVPHSPDIEAFLRERAPDVVVITPLIILRTVQLDLLRAADAIGIPTVFAVASWDHLSSKGILWSHPDRMLVWNEVQAEEAVRFHGVPRPRVRVTGAQLFDVWFDRPASRSREQFCARMALDPARPYVLYVGSALFEGSPSEAEAAADWVRALRGCDDEVVRDSGVLLRPHPRRVEEWTASGFAALPNVVLCAPGSDAIDAAWRDDYCDSMRFAAAVVGINTSAMVEASILGRPVLSVLRPEFASNQEGTIHFRYLTGEDGLIETSRTMDEHLRGLGRALRAEGPSARSERFVGRFIRPLGRGVEATDRAAGEIETAAGMAKRPAAPPARAARLLRVVLTPFARRVAREAVATRTMLAVSSKKPAKTQRAH